MTATMDELIQTEDEVDEMPSRNWQRTAFISVMMLLVGFLIGLFAGLSSAGSNYQTGCTAGYRVAAQYGQNEDPVSTTFQNNNYTKITTDTGCIFERP